ncbi:MAG: tRNA (N(6)-L-threonylcarbamoyladenosine(37)-C(2))-methylthiotransferase MtaB, partial [Sphingobacteriia bacterium]|nr:tRNA (N(6)-L-threonylcarbamoyladenosine(37)-C(2))-methylthiotransferase MtaB [Sphingobacteriia bacterium]
MNTNILQGKTVATYTLGCKLNFAETSYLLKSLIAKGLKKVKAGEIADICIINTCSVT